MTGRDSPDLLPLCLSRHFVTATLAEVFQIREVTTWTPADLRACPGIFARDAQASQRMSSFCTEPIPANARQTCTSAGHVIISHRTR